MANSLRPILEKPILLVTISNGTVDDIKQCTVVTLTVLLQFSATLVIERDQSQNRTHSFQYGSPKLLLYGYET